MSHQPDPETPRLNLLSERGFSGIPGMSSRAPSAFTPIAPLLNSREPSAWGNLNFSFSLSKTPSLTDPNMLLVNPEPDLSTKKEENCIEIKPQPPKPESSAVANLMVKTYFMDTAFGSGTKKDNNGAK